MRIQLWHIGRYLQARDEADSLGGLPGSRSTAQGLCTWLMGFGFVGVAIGYFAQLNFAYLLGGPLLVAGLVIAFVQAIFDK